MPRRKPPAKVRFIVEFEVGSSSSFIVDEYTLRTGDHVAVVVAGERQRKGELRAGKIKSVRRAPASEQPQ
jgi:hypothetical protein